MVSGFCFPILSPAKIAEELVEFDVAPFASLCAENIASPQPDLLPGVLDRFFRYFVDAPGDVEGGQLGFSELEVLDNPEHHAEAIRMMRLYIKSRTFLESIHCGLTLDDFTNPVPPRVVAVLSALINFLLHREDKMKLLGPIVVEAPDSHEHDQELNARIAQLRKEIADHELAEQMEEPMAQQLEADVSSLQQKVQVYNKQHLALLAKATAINDKKEEIQMKITRADFELTKHAQENSKLRSKLVKSPETVQDVHEQLAAAKTVEKEVKTRKAKLNDGSVSVMSFEAQIVEWEGKVHEMEGHLKTKVEERNQIIADENQKLGALSSEIEGKLQCLEPSEKKAKTMTAKAPNLCSEAASTKVDATFNKIVKVFNTCMDSVGPSLERVEEVGSREHASAPDPSAAVATKTTPNSSATSKKLRARKRT